MEWYQEWMEFETDISPAELKRRLNNQELLSQYDCVAEIQRDDSFTISSTEGSFLRREFVFRGSICKQEGRNYIVGNFGWSNMFYGLCTVTVALFALVLVMINIMKDIRLDLTCMLFMFLALIVIVGLLYALNVYGNGSTEVTWKDVYANTVLRFIRQELVTD